MGDPAGKPKTYADLQRLTVPGGPVPELIDGEIVYRASPRAKHAWSQRRIGAVLDSVDGGDDWWLLVEPDVVFSNHRVLVPDLAGWRRSRMPDLPDGPVRLAPDWVCELLSPGHEGYDRRTKRDIYAHQRVPWLWLVGPEQRFVEVFELIDGAWMVRGTWGHGTHVLLPFDIEIDVGSLFARGRDEPPMAHELQAASYG